MKHFGYDAWIAWGRAVALWRLLTLFQVVYLLSAVAFPFPATPTSDFTLKLSYFAHAVCLLGCFDWGEDLFVLTPVGQVWFFPGHTPVVTELSQPLS